MLEDRRQAEKKLAAEKVVRVGVLISAFYENRNEFN